MQSLSLSRICAAVGLVASLLSSTCATALAGTTGGIVGTIHDVTGKPVAGAVITLTSPSQTATGKSDASGHFAFVSLAPDTYTLSVAHDGYAPYTEPGISVFADATQAHDVALQPLLRTIAKVTSVSAGALVHSGQTADVYSVNAATQAKLGGVGGGGGLNSAYSAIATVPGVYVPYNQNGYYQTVHIRGGDYDQVGYEFDGVPVNRSFDNYPSGSASSLGEQEIQVYTGAEPANSESQGLAGFINQVIKTGTYPGFAQATLGVGDPSFYHKAAVEIGGATPDRMFSYYLGIGGYNQAYRYIDQSNGAGYASTYGQPIGYDSNGDPILDGPQTFLLSDIAERAVVANVHFEIPHKYDGGRDDVQLLWDSELLHNEFYSSPSDLGIDGQPVYIGSYVYGGQLGAPIGANYQALTSPYSFPNSPTGSTGLPIADELRDTTWNDQEIVKLQYQKNIGGSAYLRLYGYTYYSDWLNNSPNAANLGAGATYFGPDPADYELSSHTRGLSATFVDEIGSKNLVSLQTSLTTSQALRDNNSTMYNAGSTFGLLVNANAPMSGICYAMVNATSTQATTCNPLGLGSPGTSAYPLPSNVTLQQAATGAITLPAGQVCGTGACEYLAVENGESGFYNQVQPLFTSYSITDDFRPSDRLTLNYGVRLDSYKFTGADTTATAGRAFWYDAFNQDVCANAAGELIDKSQIGNAGVPVATPCTSIPGDYSNVSLTNASGQVAQYNVVQPRLAATYAVNGNTVLRASYGRYAQPPDTAYEQYNTLQQNLPGAIASAFYQYGFTTPSHPIRPPVSYNTDFSYEHNFKGTDWSVKVSPFLRKTQDQIQNFFLDQATNFVSGLNVGRLTAEGFEMQVQKGDFSRDGLAGMVSFAYTNEYVKYAPLPNDSSVFSQINSSIKTYNAYTSFCASNPTNAKCGQTLEGGTAAACYNPTTHAPDPSCTAGDVANPYWNAPAQGLLDPNASYAPYDLLPGGIGSSYDSYEVPYVATAVLNYKHQRWDITPSLQFEAGNRYGAPLTTPGVDPALCSGTLSGAVDSARYPYGAPGGSPYDATTCGSATLNIPDPYTNAFDDLGAFRNPSLIAANLQLSYEVSPRVTITATLANLVNHCFGGQVVGPGNLSNADVCSYGVIAGGALSPVGNIYNPGTSVPPIERYPYEPLFGVFNANQYNDKQPFTAFIEARIKL